MAIFMSDNGSESSEEPATPSKGTPFSAREAAHDLNNLLAVIHGRAEILLADEQLKLEGNECLEQIVRAVERAGRLTRQLLAAADAATAQPEMESSPRGAEPISHGSGRILLLAEDQGLRRFISLLLKSAGYELMEAPSLADGVRMWESSPQGFDLLVTDLAADSEASLISVLNNWRGSSGKLKILLLTDVSRRAPALEMSSIRAHTLARPFSPEELAQKVRLCLGSEE